MKIFVDQLAHNNVLAASIEFIRISSNKIKSYRGLHF